MLLCLCTLLLIFFREKEAEFFFLPATCARARFFFFSQLLSPFSKWLKGTKVEEGEEEEEDRAGPLGPHTLTHTLGICRCHFFLLLLKRKEKKKTRWPSFSELVVVVFLSRPRSNSCAHFGSRA